MEFRFTDEQLEVQQKAEDPGLLSEGDLPRPQRTWMRLRRKKRRG